MYNISEKTTIYLENTSLGLRMDLALDNERQSTENEVSKSLNNFLRAKNVYCQSICKDLESGK
jgi:hypothetical protein